MTRVSITEKEAGAVGKLAVVADLYSRKDLESTDGKVTKRGKQIATEFYRLAKIALKQ